MNLSHERRQHDRLAVEPLDSLGFLEHETVGTAVKVIERSQGGFTVSIAPEKAKLFPGGENATLSIGKQHFKVMISGYCREGNRKSHLGLKLVSTDAPPKRNTHRLRKKASKSAEGTHREKFSYGLFLALFIALFMLPGIGDWLGTAPWIRSLILDALAYVEAANFQS